MSEYRGFDRTPPVACARPEAGGAQAAPGTDRIRYVGSGRQHAVERLKHDLGRAVPLSQADIDRPPPPLRSGPLWGDDARPLTPGQLALVLMACSLVAVCAALAVAVYLWSRGRIVWSA